MRRVKRIDARALIEGLEGRRLLTASLLGTSMGDDVSGGALTDTIQRSEVRDLALSFDQPVTMGAGAVTLGRFSGTTASGPMSDATEGLGVPTSADGGTTWIIPVLAGTDHTDATGSLRDGIYLATVHAADVTDPSNSPLAGGDRVIQFERLFGDFDGNGAVNGADYFAFKKAFGTVAGDSGYSASLDYDANGRINTADYFQFKQRFGSRLNLLASISLGPSGLSLAGGTRYGFSATGYDQFGKVMAGQPAFSWSVVSGGAGGSIDAQGVYTSPFSGIGADTIVASANGVSGTLTTTVTSPGIFNAGNDIGAPGQPGHYFYSGGAYTVSGSGSDIWNASDQFNFASTQLTGDGVIEARVLTTQNTDYWTKAGLMFRNSLAAGSTDAYVTMTPHNQVQFLDRPTAGMNAADSGDASNVPFPMWMKLVRQENSFTGFWSPDGKTWTQLGAPVKINMAATVYVGLVSSSHNNAVVSASVFDHVSVTAMPSTGVYRLSTRGQPGLSLDVEGFGNANGTPVSLYYANHTSNQQWLVEGQGDGTYKIYAYSGQNSLQMLDDTGGGIGNGNTVTTYEDNNTSAQRWIFLPVGAGYWRIIPENGAGTNQTLDIQNGNNEGVGSRTDIYTYGGGYNQQFQLDDPGPQAILPSPKKGLAGNPDEIGNTHPSWMYNWGGSEPAGLPASVEFVPMTWGYYGNANNNFVNYLKGVQAQPGIHTILGYNEPDNTGQANVSVSSALDGWQYLQNTGLPLGSPAGTHAEDQWMQDFMAGAAQRGYRVDYVTIHWYGGDDPTGFLSYVDYIHNLYNKPVWITEFAPADWSGQHGISAQQAADFMRQVIPQLNQRSYVQRYSWFSASTGDAALGQSALFNNDRSLTELGKLYARM